MRLPMFGTLIVMSACSSQTLPLAERDEVEANENGIAYSLRYEPYGITVEAIEGEEQETVVLADYYQPLITVSRQDGTETSVADRDTALRLAVEYCQERGIAVADAGNARLVFDGGMWWVYGVCERPPNTRDLLVS